jgi:plastocyanin
MRSKRSSLLFAGAMMLVLALAACSSNSTPASPTPSPSGGGGGGGAADVTITIVGMNGGQSYSPNPGLVKAGQTVSWKNGDAITHTATADNGAFNTGNIAPGATSAPITMAAAGTIAYHCAIHPSMIGAVQVQ